MKELFEYAKASRKGSNETVEFLMFIGVNDENQQLAMAADPVKNGEEYIINGETYSVESIKEYHDEKAGFVRRDCLLKRK